MGRGRAQTARTGGGSERLQSASADTLRLPSCSLVSVRAPACLCSPEVAADLQGEMFQGGHFVPERDLKRDQWVKVTDLDMCRTMYAFLNVKV